MAFDDKEKLSKIDDLKSKLFSRNYIPKVEHYDAYRHTAPAAPDSWTHETKNDQKSSHMKTSIFKKFFIFSLIFFALSMLYVVFSFFGGGNSVSNDNIEISVLGNAFTNGGEDLPLIVEIANRNNVALELVDLVVETPRSNTTNAPTDRQRISLGSIPAGAARSENVIVRMFGEQGSLQTIRMSIEYRVPGSNAIFVKEKPYEVTIESTPINLLVEAPNEIPPNQDVTFKIKATINREERADNILIRIDYPLGFEFSKATPLPSLGNNVFELGTLEPGIEYQIAVTGKMVDVWDGEEKTFKVWSGSQSTKDKADIDVVFSSLAHTMRINRPFIEANLSIGGDYSREYAAQSGSVVTGEVRWANNLDTKVTDMQIRVKLSGNALDRKTIKATRGFYNSSEDTIIWDKNSDDAFAEVEPGDSGLLTFSFSSKQLYTSSEGILNQPTINLSASITGKQAIAGSVAKKIESNDTKVVKIISNVGFSNQVVYYTGPFTNTGPLPPKVETETTYTVIWNITNTSNMIRNTKVRATLPPWVKFAGTISPADASLTYNSSTKEIVWDAGTIPRGVGYGSDGTEVAFQIIFTPSLSQLDDTPDLLNEAVLTGRDDFANVDVRINRSSLNTKLSGDASFDAKKARVVE